MRPGPWKWDGVDAPGMSGNGDLGGGKRSAMTEGRVFIARWKKTQNGYRVWVKNSPKLVAEAPTFQDADEALWDVIMRATDDGENTREYDPPAPAAAEIAAFLDPAIVRITGNAGGVYADPAGLFSEGCCERCGATRGARTDKSLFVADIGAEDAGFATLKTQPMYARVRIAYFSERFLALLTPKERNSFTWRRIERPPRARKVYFELLGANVLIPSVGVTGLPIAGAPDKPFGWYCESCGYGAAPHYGKWGEPWPLNYVCRADLPDPIPSTFGLQAGRNLSLCMLQDRWRKILGNRSARDVVSDDVGVVPLDRCDRAPPRRELAEVLPGS
jgi:hypothetical protein